MGIDVPADIEAYRLAAGEWLAANLERRDPAQGAGLRGLDHRTIEGIAEERAIQRRLYESGYAGITWPVEYGGQGLTLAHQRAFDEAAAGYRLPDFGIAGATTMGACAGTMLAHASPEFLRHHIPRILAGDELWVQFFSEPGAGSDLAGVTTRATRDGDRWILSGSKVWSSGAYYADYGMCLARTDWDVPKHRGLTWFAVRIGAPGVTVRPIREINGDAEFCQEFFDDVELTDDDVIGEVNQGWSVAQTMLVFERGAVRYDAPDDRGPTALAPDLVALARRLGRDQDPHVRQLIARAHANDYVAHQLALRIAGLMRDGRGGDAGVAAYGKLARGVFRALRARIGMEIGRGGALVWEPGDVEGQTAAVNYLNGRLTAIAGGTNEMQRNGIGERVLGLPREPSFDTGVPFREVVRRSRDWFGTAPPRAPIS
ncbi:MAG TPA: acyl-CoA dehydrogenase family protein [Acidimicrobiales bacterium]|nr:acyl-CoA dehydrogenase family protein [Acidimicrobiales bacterium]